MQVAVLQAVDRSRGWKLQCKYQWEEETTVKSKGKGKKEVAIPRRNSSGFNNVFGKGADGWRSGDQVSTSSEDEDMDAIQNRIHGLMITGTYGSDAPAPTAGGIVHLQCPRRVLRTHLFRCLKRRHRHLHSHRLHILWQSF